ncbi:SgrR family transcriptional regulator [Enterobacillus tribolii]|uniref:MarR-like DNA-binding transcriptional regulator SgrR of sgrS sRNA n=1 Tax=Enterobacillus tribolii TaxID=1487935 RepID=A0A370QNG3_9GAMM|nr:SgrR family transcriptional regulator [Enterobacillus tribolii]MBW7982065.1 SgrR family transcriptional regulator [Enterobacillus tribolii]RDK89914.1 MarR-like DNA-binding transcriptional regulator SgrR of sgrS sRNA [Enterobacillus tribolii]
MRLLQRVNQYQRLYQHVGERPVAITVAELAAVFCCSERHVRTLLIHMQSLEWISWQASAGRGKRAQLHCLIPEQQLRANLLQQMLASGDHQGALKLAERDPLHLNALLSPHLGGQWQSDLPTLRIPYYRPLGNIDPQTLSGRAEQHLAHSIHAGLTRFVTGNPEPQPDLAHHWQISPDGLRWQFLLRSDLIWHNGQPVMAAQLLDVLQRLLRHPRLTLLLDSVEQISQPHPLCLRFKLRKPDYWLAHRLADLVCLLPNPEHPETGAGPFRLAGNSPSLLRLEQHPHYHLQHPYLHAIEYWITAGKNSPAPAPNAQHPVHITIGENSEQIDTRLAQSGLSLGFCYIALNQRQGRLSPAQARKLIALFRGQETLDSLPLASGLISRSQELLPGWPLPQEEADLSVPLPSKLVLLYHPPVELTTLAEYMRDRLAQEGCRLEIRYHHAKRWRNVEQFTDVDIVLGDRLIGESPEATLENWLRTDIQWPMLFDNAAWDDCRRQLDHIQRCADTARRHRELRDYYTLLMAQGVLAPLFNYQYRISAPARVEGVRLTASGWFDFSQVWVPAPE